MRYAEIANAVCTEFMESIQKSYLVQFVLPARFSIQFVTRPRSLHIYISVSRFSSIFCESPALQGLALAYLLKLGFLGFGPWTFGVLVHSIGSSNFDYVFEWFELALLILLTFLTLLASLIWLASLILLASLLLLTSLIFSLRSFARFAHLLASLICSLRSFARFAHLLASLILICLKYNSNKLKIKYAEFLLNPRYCEAIPILGMQNLKKSRSSLCWGTYLFYINVYGRSTLCTEMLTKAKSGYIVYKNIP